MGLGASLVAWGSSEKNTLVALALGDTVPSSTPAILVGAGYATALVGLYRMKRELGVGAALGLFLVGYINRKRLRNGMKPLPVPGLDFRLSVMKHGMDRGLDQATEEAARAALAQETDPAMLQAFAARLSAAGYTIAATIMARRAAMLSQAKGGT